MALDSFVGAFNITTQAATNTVAVTGVGFVPKLLIFFWSGQTSATDAVTGQNAKAGIGFCCGTTDRRSAAVSFQDANGQADGDRTTEPAAAICAVDVLGASIGLADLSSFDADGFTMVIDEQFVNNQRIGFWALGGSTLTNCATGDFLRPTSTGNNAQTGVGFEPDLMMFFGIGANAQDALGTHAILTLGVYDGTNEWTQCVGMKNNQSTTICGTYFYTGECFGTLDITPNAVIARATGVSLDADGFTLNWLEAASPAKYVHYLAIKGPSVAVGSVTTLTSVADLAAESGFGFQPDGALFVSAGQAEATQDTATANDAQTIIGAFSATDERVAVAGFSEHNVGTSRTTDAIEHDEIYVRINRSDGVDALMDIKTIGSDGFTLTMDNADSAAHAVGYLALGVADSGIAGIADFNLPSLSITAIGDAVNRGIADFALPNLTIDGIGDIPIIGVADFDLPNLTIDGVGTIPIEGLADFPLPNLTIDGAGNLPIDGIADFNLPVLTIDGTGDIALFGVADFSLPNLTVDAFGGESPPVSGIADFNLPNLWIQTQGGVDIPMISIYSITGQTGADTGTAFALQRRQDVWLLNRDVLAQIILGAGSATIHVEGSLDGGSTFTDLVSSMTASTMSAFNMPPMIRVRLSAATGATVNVYLDADVIATRTDS